MFALVAHFSNLWPPYLIVLSDTRYCSHKRGQRLVSKQAGPYNVPDGGFAGGNNDD